MVLQSPLWSHGSARGPSHFLRMWPLCQKWEGPPWVLRTQRVASPVLLKVAPNMQGWGGPEDRVTAVCPQDLAAGATGAIIVR